MTVKVMTEEVCSVRDPEVERIINRLHLQLFRFPTTTNVALERWLDLKGGNRWQIISKTDYNVREYVVQEARRRWRAGQVPNDEQQSRTSRLYL